MPDHGVYIVAREFAGQRYNSVFFTPSAEVLDQATLTEAMRWPGAKAGRGSPLRCSP